MMWAFGLLQIVSWSAAEGAAVDGSVGTTELSEQAAAPATTASRAKPVDRRDTGSTSSK
jgi:hypothetical protein